MNSTAAERPFRRRLGGSAIDLMVTGGGQVTIAAASLLVYRVLATQRGAHGFAAYALVRQGAWLVFPIVMVGTTVSLPRSLALRPTGEGERERDLIGAIIICGALTALGCGLLLLAPGAVAALLFGSSRSSGLVGPLVVTLGATVLYTLAYGYRRGCFQLRRGAVIQVLGLGVSPVLVALALRGQPLAAVIYAMAIVLAGLSLAALAAPAARGLQSWGWERGKAAIIGLVSFGHRRVPGDLAYLVLFSVAPVAVAHAGSAGDVAHFVAGQQVLLLMHVLFMPVGLVLLPTLSRLWAVDRGEARRFVSQFSALAAHLALFALFQALVFVDLFIRAWFGARFAAGDSIARVVVVPSAAFAFYLALRSPLDAAALKSYNSRNNMIAVAALVISTAILLILAIARPVMCVTWGFAVGITVQGVLTFLSVNRVFDLNWRQYQFQLAVPLCAIAGGVAIALRGVIEHSAIALPLLVITELGLASAYIGALTRAGVSWPRFFAARILLGEAAAPAPSTVQAPMVIS